MGKCVSVYYHDKQCVSDFIYWAKTTSWTVEAMGSYTGMCPRCGGARFDGACLMCRFDGPGRGSKYVEPPASSDCSVLNAIPAGEILTATVVFRNRVHDDRETFSVTLDLPQGRIVACSGISFVGALKKFARRCALDLPGLVGALPKNEVGCTPLGEMIGLVEPGCKLRTKVKAG